MTAGLLLIGALQAGAADGPRAGVPFDLQGFIDAAVAAGRTRIVLPPGRHRVTPRKREHLALRGLSDIEIVADGVELICTETTRALTVEDCVRVRIRGLTVDYDPLPFTQGVITALTDDKSAIEFELLAGYPDNLVERIEIFDGRTHLLKTYTRYDWQGFEPLGGRRYRVRKGERYRYNPEADREEVGDILVTNSEHAPGGSIPHAIYTNRSTGIVYEDVTVYASNCFTYFETACDGTTYLRCRLDRRAPGDDLKDRAVRRIRSADADAFHSKHAVRGPRILSCIAKYQGDDCVNICGDYHLVTGSAGAELRVLAKHRMDLEADTPVELLTYEGVRLPDARIVAVRPAGEIREEEKAFLRKQGMNDGLKNNRGGALSAAFTVTLDRPVEMPMGSMICSLLSTGNGFEVRDCDFGFNRSRGILIKASGGIVAGNRIRNCWGEAIKVAPEFWWLESGSSCDVRIENNAIENCRDIGIAVYAFGGTGAVAPAGAHRDIRVTGNTIRNSPSPNILVTSTANLTVEDNRCRPRPEVVGAAKWRFKLDDEAGRPVVTLRCTDADGAPLPVFETDGVSWNNPILFEGAGPDGRSEVRDPCIIREGDTYYLVYTMWPFANREEDRLDLPDNGSSPGIRMFSSRNLTDWEEVGWLVKGSELPEDCPYRHRFWAPEIHKIGGRFYLIFTADNWLRKEYNPAGSWGAAGYAFVGVSDAVTGPYEHITYIPEGCCDTSLLEGADGKTYAVLPAGDIFIREIDLSRIEQGDVRLLGERTRILTGDDADVGVAQKARYLEGPWARREGDRYVLAYAAYAPALDDPAGDRMEYWTGFATAEDPLGPWVKNRAGFRVFHGGHVALFDGPDGNAWVAYRGEKIPETRGRLCIDPLNRARDGVPAPSEPTLGPQEDPLP